MEIKNQVYADNLQYDLQALYRWATVNNMDFNSKKFEKITYNKKAQIHYLMNIPVPLKIPLKTKQL